MGTLAAVLVAFLCLKRVAAEGNRLITTVDQPAVITAVTAMPELPADRPPRVVISVMAFRPPRDGAVQAVVRIQRNGSGSQLEIGRFGLFPNVEFRAAEPSKAQRFGFTLPKEFASGSSVKLEVQLLPLQGDGKDARLEIGGAEIR
jgi:hypothetical protein